MALLPTTITPAKAGVHLRLASAKVDSGFRRNDEG
jgi:hypothetical protein